MYPPNQGGGQGPFGPQQGAPQATGSAFGGVPTNAPAGGPFRTAPGSYEFNQQENEVFSSLAMLTKVAGALLIASLVVGAIQSLVMISRLREGAMVAVGPIIGGIAIGAVMSGIFAFMMFRSSSAFARVANTQGNDIPNLMDALSTQRRYFTVMKVLMIVVMVFGVLACFGAIALGGLFASMH